MNIIVNLNDLLVILSSELWSQDSNYPAIKICYTFKRNTRITGFTLCAIIIPRQTRAPLSIDNVNRSAANGQTNFVIILGQSIQLSMIPRQIDKLVLPIDYCIYEDEETIIHLGYADKRHHATLTKRVTVSKAEKHQHDEQLTPLMEILSELDQSWHCDIPG